MAITITVNGQPQVLEADKSLPLVFALRNILGLKGVRFGCGGEDCGACTVIVDGELCYSCTTSLDAVAGRRVETIDGMDGAKATALREAFIAERAGQCGYCLSGIHDRVYDFAVIAAANSHRHCKSALSQFMQMRFSREHHTGGRESCRDGLGLRGIHE